MYNNSKMYIYVYIYNNSKMIKFENVKIRECKNDGI